MAEMYRCTCPPLRHEDYCQECTWCGEYARSGYAHEALCCLPCEGGVSDPNEARHSRDCPRCSGSWIEWSVRCPSCGLTGFFKDSGKFWPSPLGPGFFELPEHTGDGPCGNAGRCESSGEVVESEEYICFGHPSP